VGPSASTALQGRAASARSVRVSQIPIVSEGLVGRCVGRGGLSMVVVPFG
jgi:hypothetical protein